MASLLQPFATTTASPQPPGASSNSGSVYNTNSPEASPSSAPSEYGPEEPIFPPMTTPWSTPLSCTWTYNADQKTGSGAIAILDLEPTANATTMSCYPDGMIFQGRTGVFSPATCPRGWTTVSVYRDTNQPHGWATTTAICCSSEYTLDGAYCKRNMPTALAVPITYNQTAETYDVFSAETSTLISGTLAVHTIRALFQDEDKAALGITDDDDIDGNYGQGGLNFNARVGIGVGVSLAGLLFIGILSFFLCRKKRRKGGQGRGTPHELGQGCRHCNLDHSCPRCRHTLDEAEPPPAYVATETDSINDAEGSDDQSRDDEIRILRAQKAAIHRRIQELENADTNRENR